jgi:hypothetical protein
MEYENASEMHCTSGHTIKSHSKLLYKDFKDVVADDIEGDDNLGGTCSKDLVLAMIII